MVATVLLTLGRLPKALDLARGFAGIGYRVIVAEPLGWHLCRVSRAVDRSVRVTAPKANPVRYLEDLLAVIEREHVDLVVPVSEEALHAVALKPRLPAGVRFFSEDQSVLLGLHDKWRFAKQAACYGLAVPETYLLGSADAAGLSHRQDVVVKPVNSCAGIGMQRLSRGASLPPARREAASIVQAYIAGRHLSTFSLAHEGRVVANAIYEGTVFSGCVAVAFRLVPEHAGITEWVETFAARSGYSGFMSFDFIVDDADRTWAIECNPRVTSGVHFLKADQLAQAILDPGSQTAVEFRSKTHMQQFFPCLVETYACLFRRRNFRRSLRHLLGSRDVMWQARDPWPLILMTFTSFEILRRSIFEGMSFGKAATVDIAWFGEPAREGAD